MSWAQALDVALFRFVNQRLANPFLDSVMPFFSGNRFFIPALICLSIFLLWRGGSRARVFVPVLFLILALGDGLVINTIKHAVARPRPYLQLDGVRELLGRGESGSMPSSHTSTWFAATFLAYTFYRRSWRAMLPLALLVGFSRMYVGAHFPSDVLAGAMLGAGYGAAGLFAVNAVWRTWGRKWFPEQWRRWPSLFGTPAVLCVDPPTPIQVDVQARWIFLGHLVIAVTLIARLLYIGAGKIELSEDEAYQWLWSRHLALSYFSKPPLIAIAQFIGTSLFGNNEFGVRFLSPVIAALVSLMLLRFVAKEANARAAFWLVACLQCVPLAAVGATLMTIDPLLVLFWTVAIIAGWRAVQPGGKTSDWIWVGVAIGAGFLSKYSAAYQIICFLFFLLFWKPARQQLRRPGPWLALLIVALCTLPVIVWNSQHDWITLHHVSQNAGLDKQWHWTSRFLVDFVVSEFFLLNPIFLIAGLWAWVALWRQQNRSGFLVYLFWMGAPVLLGHLLYTLHSRVFPNWIAPAIVPLLCTAAVFWDERWRTGATRLKPWLIAGILIGAIPIILLHDTNLITKIAGKPLSANLDPLRRVRGWHQTAVAVAAARESLLQEGKPVFIIAAHYGLVGEISFYLPEAKAQVSRTPLVYYQSADHPENQFYFWPGYQSHSGENAIYVREEKPTEPFSARIEKEFDSIADLGVREIEYRGRIFRTLHFYACHNLHANGTN